MDHPIYRVESFEIVGPYILLVRFDDNEEQEINFRPVLAGELYGPLQDLSVFEKVRIDPEAHTLVWPNGADFDPATLHDWHEQIDALKEEIARWELSCPEIGLHLKMGQAAKKTVEAVYSQWFRLSQPVNLHYRNYCFLLSINRH